MITGESAERIIQKIRKSKARKLMIQVPEGMKTSVLGLADMIEKEIKGSEVIVGCDPCYGACDIRDDEARRLGCDALVHIGHTEMAIGRKPTVPIIFEEYRIDVDPVPLLKKHLELLKPSKKVCLVTTAQYISSLDKAKKFLEDNGKEVFIGQPSVASHQGQVLGCDFSAAEPFENIVDSFLFLGTGRFHPIGLATRVQKPVLVLDYELGTLENMHRERDMLLRIRAAHVEKAKDAQRFGILVSTKPGQMHLETAHKSKAFLESTGKDAWILVMNEISPSKIMGMKLQALVNCSCPRLTEDFRQFKMPMLNPEDVKKIG